MRVGRARVWEDEDYAHVRKLCLDMDGWVEVYKKGHKRIYSQSIGSTAVQMYKAHLVWSDVPADVLFDVLHDGSYRATWDKHMTKSDEIGMLNPNNDLCYYAVKSITPIRPRDFVLQRSWLDTGAEKLLCSHSVCHDDYPPREGHIRATTYTSGYLIRELKKGGCEVIYVTHTDPGGKIPTWLVNRASKSMAPKVLDKLHKSCLAYPGWKAANRPHWKPWIYPDQLIDAPRVDIRKCDPREYEVSCEDGVDVEDDDESGSES